MHAPLYPSLATPLASCWENEATANHTIIHNIESTNITALWFRYIAMHSFTPPTDAIAMVRLLAPPQQLTAPLHITDHAQTCSSILNQ